MHQVFRRRCTTSHRRRVRLAAAFLLLLSAAAAPAPYSDTLTGNQTVETLVYHDIGRYASVIFRLCSEFRVEPATVAAILYAEKVQYELDLLRSGKQELERLVETFPVFMSDLYTWSQLSAGDTHVKEAFARETRRRLEQSIEYSDRLDEEDVDPAYYIRHPETALAISVAGLAMLAAQWREHPRGCDISGSPGILATLYNIGYRNSHPKPDPRLGGSVMPIIIDGQVFTGLSFGERVERLCTESRAFRDFMLTHFPGHTAMQGDQ